MCSFSSDVYADSSVWPRANAVQAEEMPSFERTILQALFLLTYHLSDLSYVHPGYQYPDHGLDWTHQYWLENAL